MSSKILLSIGVLVFICGFVSGFLSAKLMEKDPPSVDTALYFQNGYAAGRMAMQEVLDYEKELIRRDAVDFFTLLPQTAIDAINTSRNIHTENIIRRVLAELERLYFERNPKGSGGGGEGSVDSSSPEGTGT